jgi:hypothetical protein
LGSGTAASGHLTVPRRVGEVTPVSPPGFGKTPDTPTGAGSDVPDLWWIEHYWRTAPFSGYFVGPTKAILGD